MRVRLRRIEDDASSGCLWRVVRDDAFAFADRQDLVGLDLRELLNFLRGWPLHFDGVNDLRLADTEVEAKVALRHYAGAAVHLIHLNVLAGDHPCTRANRRAIAPGSNELELDPVLLVRAKVL